MSETLRNIELRRPLAVLDIKATGTRPDADRIVQVGIIRIEPGGCDPTRIGRIVNPGVPIPPEAAAIHGITDDDVEGRMPFEEVADYILRLLDGADLAGFGIARFNLPLLAAEMRRAGHDFSVAGRSVVDAMRIFHDRERRDLAAAVRLYCGREHSEAHSALADAEAALAVLDAQVERYGLPRTVRGLHEASTDLDVGGRLRSDGGRVVLAFGKHRGRPLEDVAVRDADYLRWFLAQDFLDDAKALVRAALAAARRGPK